MLTQKAHQAKHKYRDNFLSRQILQHQFSWRTRLIIKHYSSLKVTHTAESFTRHQLCIFWCQSKHIPSFLPSPATAVSQQCWCHWLHVYQLPPDTERWCICAMPQEHHNMRTSPAFREMHLVSFYSFQLHQLDWLCPSLQTVLSHICSFKSASKIPIRWQLVKQEHLSPLTRLGEHVNSSYLAHSEGHSVTYVSKVKYKS